MRQVPATHTFDFRFLQLSQAINVIFPRGVLKAYVPEIGDWCRLLELPKDPVKPCFGAKGAFWFAANDDCGLSECGKVSKCRVPWPRLQGVVSWL